MAEVVTRRARQVEPFDVFETFDRMFGEWAKMLPFRTPVVSGRGWQSEEVIPVDEYREDGSLVVRAELPGIDPARDVEVRVEEGMLQIEAERREEKKVEEKGYVRHELRSGHFTRRLVLPEGVSEANIQASYKDGILEIRIPAPQPKPSTKIPVRTS